MTREQKITKARELRSEGRSYAEIGEALGVIRATVSTWLNPDAAKEWRRRDNARRAATKRQWENENDRPDCPRCGEPMGIGAHRKGTEVCASCRHELWTAQRDAVADLDAEGLEPREIATRLGMTRAAVRTHLCRLRKEGRARPRPVGVYTRKAA